MEGAVMIDVHAALLFLRSQLYNAYQLAAGIPPVICKHQVYTVLSDRTVVDREVDQLRLSGAIRIFTLATGSEEHGLMLQEDYLKALCYSEPPPAQPPAGSHTRQQPQQQPPGKRQRLQQPAGGASAPGASPAAAAAPAGGCRCGTPASAAQPPACSPAVQAFVEQVLPECQDSRIAGHRLRELLVRRACGGLSGGDAALAALLQAGVVVRDPLCHGDYLLHAPGMGQVVRWLAAGRNELTALLKKRKYGQMPEQELLTKRKLAQTKLGVAFHVRDLLGRGDAVRLESPAGAFIKLLQR